MIATIGNVRVAWEGGHYAHVKHPNGYAEPFSFAWEKNKTTQLDFTEALQNWMNDVEKFICEMCESDENPRSTIWDEMCIYCTETCHVANLEIARNEIAKYEGSRE
jgi:cyclopropane fatty-acyl-phospholipid synthase-like methyltransferase